MRSAECGMRNAECKDKCKPVAPHTPGKVASGEILFSLISSGPLLFSAPLREERLSALHYDFRVPHSAFRIPSSAFVRARLCASSFPLRVPHSAFPFPISRPLTCVRSRSACEQTHTGRAKIAKRGFF